MGWMRNRSCAPLISPLADVLLTLVFITVATGAMHLLQQQSRAKDLPSVASLAVWGQRVNSLLCRYEALSQELGRLPSPDQFPAVDLKALESERQHLLGKLAELRQEIERVEEALQQFQQQHGQVTQEQKRQLKELAKLRQQLKAMEDKMRRMKQDREKMEQLKKALQDLLRRQKETLTKHRDLQENIAAEKAERNQSAVVIKVHPRVHVRRELKRKLVVISQAVVTPVCEPYYAPEYNAGQLVRVRFVRTGQSVSEVLKDGSHFMVWLDSLDPQNQYVAMLVDSDSLETFRAVRAEFRKRNIVCGWEPYEPGHTNFRFVREGGLNPPPQ